MRIGDKEIGEGNPTFICAEIGINANGSVDLAKQLIDVASIAGADMIKFQKRNVDVVYTKEELDKPRESPFGATNGDLKRGLEFGIAEYAEIDNYCHQKGIMWTASPWDISSVSFLEHFDVPAYKVASACLTDEALLWSINDTGKPVILSTGMSTMEQVRTAVGAFPEDRVAILACTSTYPAKVHELNLARIETLDKEFYPCPIGYSNHSPGLWMSLAAVAMGAALLEVHITLDRASWGSDQAASIEPSGFIKLVREIRDLEKARGSGELGILKSEEPILQKLRRYK